MEIVTRFAPSPTGRLHLGHAWSALQAHDRAREAGGRFLLRIEDIDGARSRPEHVAAIAEDLAWLGLGWDGEMVFQSRRLALYAAALERLKAMALLYPCFCTRADIAASLGAPHEGEAAVYPGTCRGLDEAARRARMGEPHTWRLDVGKALAVLPELARGGGPLAKRVVEGQFRPLCRPLHQPSAGIPPRNKLGEDLTWRDELAGDIIADPLSLGDVVLARKDAPASYHLAVTVDDAAQGITHVVRGRDLFAATHIHRLLQALLHLPTPVYRHHALLTGSDGQRLAKRRDAPTLAALRENGIDGRCLASELRAGRLPNGLAEA